jgi:hypothetical protein
MLTDVPFVNAQALLHESDEMSRIMPPTQTSNLTEICQTTLVKI